MNDELEKISHSKINILNMLVLDITYRKPHLHFDKEILFILNGAGQIKTQGQNYDIHQGQAIIFNSCQPHELISSLNMQVLVVQLNTDIFEQAIPQLSNIHFNRQPFELSAHPETLVHLLELGRNYFSHDTQVPLQLLGHAAFALDGILSCCDYSLLSHVEQDKRIDLQAKIQSISTYLHKNYNRKVSLEDVASRQGLTRTYFSTFFKQHFGMTFKAYLDDLRCNHAYQMLATTKESLLTITYDSGFADTRTLNKSFEQRYGMTPKAFKRKQNFDFRQALVTVQPDGDSIDQQKFYNDKEALAIIENFAKNHL